MTIKQLETFLKLKGINPENIIKTKQGYEFEINDVLMAHKFRTELNYKVFEISNKEYKFETIYIKKFACKLIKK